MKKYNWFLLILVVPFLLNTSCKKRSDSDVVPDNIKVKLSDAISVPDLDKKELILLDTISGRDLYQNLRTLIYVSDFASTLIESTLQSVKLYKIDKPMQFSYISFDDDEVKNVIVTEAANYDKLLWDYGLVITNDKDQKGFELFWNMNPLKVIAILKPGTYNSKALVMRNAMIRVDYSESDQFYDRTMMVRIAQMDSLDRKFMKNMKIFLGQKGDNIDFFGNTIHPSGYIMNPDYTGGLAWSFKGRNNTNLDIAVAKCALPPVSLSNTKMATLWMDYSMDTVLQKDMESVYTDVPVEMLEPYLVNARGLAYFIGPAGFAGSGDTPPANSGFTSTFIDLGNLEPWAPQDVYNMSIGW